MVRGILLVDPAAVELEGERGVVGDDLIAAGDVTAGDVGDHPEVELLRTLLRRGALRLARQDLRGAVHYADSPRRVCMGGQNSCQVEEIGSV